MNDLVSVSAQGISGKFDVQTSPRMRLEQVDVTDTEQALNVRCEREDDRQFHISTHWPMAGSDHRVMATMGRIEFADGVRPGFGGLMEYREHGLGLEAVGICTMLSDTGVSLVELSVPNTDVDDATTVLGRTRLAPLLTVPAANAFYPGTRLKQLWFHGRGNGFNYIETQVHGGGALIGGDEREDVGADYVVQRHDMFEDVIDLETGDVATSMVDPISPSWDVSSVFQDGELFYAVQGSNWNLLVNATRLSAHWSSPLIEMAQLEYGKLDFADTDGRRYHGRVAGFGGVGY